MHLVIGGSYDANNVFPFVVNGHGMPGVARVEQQSGVGSIKNAVRQIAAIQQLQAGGSQGIGNSLINKCGRCYLNADQVLVQCHIVEAYIMADFGSG